MLRSGGDSTSRSCSGVRGRRRARTGLGTATSSRRSDTRRRSAANAAGLVCQLRLNGRSEPAVERQRRQRPDVGRDPEAAGRAAPPRSKKLSSPNTRPSITSRPVSATRSASRLSAFVPNVGSPDPSGRGRPRASPRSTSPSASTAVSKRAVGPEPVERGGGRHQLLHRAGHAPLRGVPLEDRAVRAPVVHPRSRVAACARASRAPSAARSAPGFSIAAAAPSPQRASKSQRQAQRGHPSALDRGHGGLRAVDRARSAPARSRRGRARCAR